MLGAHPISSSVFSLMVFPHEKSELAECQTCNPLSVFMAGLPQPYSFMHQEAAMGSWRQGCGVPPPLMADREWWELIAPSLLEAWRLQVENVQDFVDKPRVYYGESKTPATPGRPFRLTTWAEAVRRSLVLR